MIDRSGTPGSPRPTTSGIRSTPGELLLLLNSDCWSPAGALDTLLARLARASRRGRGGRPAAGGRRGPPELSFGRDDLAAHRAAPEMDGCACTSGAWAGWSAGSSPSEPASATWTGSAARPAGLPGGRGGGRAARRTLLPLHRGRRLLRGHPRARPADPVHAGGHRHPPARPVARDRAGRHRMPRTGAASWPSTRSTIRAARRCCGSTCA